ncbi:alpha/beta-hydrolase [Corynespora cassiicola Philippines]|uniref:Alpha/beta-hydrolase n=1 Tax=Corynespora cassiicola Philippines TaxID=1448308 RepID=A0A2T2NQ04_CORCC|nr:alpha/beta-hydrolase [Corynespora cassiicola Philippines]
MPLSDSVFALPRPSATRGTPEPPIPGPSEAAFTAAFGTLLPPAKYLVTDVGKAAYYEIPGLVNSAPSTGDKAPDRVLFIHGVQTPALGMLPLARALHALYPCSHFALVDLWGHGLSDTPQIPHEASLFHRLLDELLDKLGWPTVHVVGFSFGGALTAGYVASRSSRISSFTLVAPAGLIRRAEFSVEEQGHLRGGGDEIAARDWVVRWLEGGDLVVPADWKERIASGEVVAEAVKEWQMREHPGHTASVVAVVRDGGVMDTDANFVRALSTGIPYLVVLGELDGICSSQQLSQLGFKNVTVVPQAGHGVVRDRVPEVTKIIRGFWEI